MSFFFAMIFLLFLLLAFCSENVECYSPVKAALVIDAKTGSVVYSFNADVQTPPASLTKMMTLLLTYKALKQRKIRMNSTIRISRNAANQSPCKLGLKVGDTITVKNAILAIITKSANDIAVALGEFIGGSEKKFVEMMNKEAKRLGMKSTIFMNPSGWKNPRQLSTASDMAKLSRELILKYREYYYLFNTKSFAYKKITMQNHNHLLGQHGDINIDGLKTGYIAASGYNLAASATHKKQRLIVVVLGGETARKRDKQVLELFKKGFKRLNNQLVDIVSSNVKSQQKTVRRLPMHQLLRQANIITFDESEKLLNDYLLYKQSVQNRKRK